MFMFFVNAMVYSSNIYIVIIIITIIAVAVRK